MLVNGQAWRAAVQRVVAIVQCHVVIRTLISLVLWSPSSAALLHATCSGSIPKRSAVANALGIDLSFRICVANSYQCSAAAKHTIDMAEAAEEKATKAAASRAAAGEDKWMKRPWQQRKSTRSNRVLTTTTTTTTFLLHRISQSRVPCSLSEESATQCSADHPPCHPHSQCHQRACWVNPGCGNEVERVRVRCC